MLDVRRLRLLHELRHRGSLAAVAQAVHVSPSAVSQHLTELEREVGTPLMEKVGRGVRLTDAGMLLADHAARILAQIEEAQADVQRQAGLAVGDVRIASPQTATVNVLPRAVALLRETNPKIIVRTEEMDTPEALEAVRTGASDIALGLDYHHNPHPLMEGVVRQQLVSERLLLAVPLGHAVTKQKGPVDVAVLEDEVWAAGTRGDMLSALVRACNDAGFEPDIRHHANDLLVLLALAAAGHAVTFVPEILLPREAPDVELRHVKSEQPWRTLFVARREQTNRPAVMAMIAAVSQSATELAARRSGKPASARRHRTVRTG